MRAYAHDRFTFPLPEHHRFPLAKYGLVRAAVAADQAVTILEARPITWDDAALAHHPEWVRRVRYGLLDARETAGLGLPWSPDLATRALHATGSTCAAARAALEDGMAAAIGGGTHHARHRTGRGYCVVNDVAIALALLRREGRVGDVLVLDLDVHQGDGNAELLAPDPATTVVSLHGARNYPFERVPSDLDVDLPDGTGDAAYLDALDDALAWALDRRRYDLAFLIAGADPW
jgi:acetoin utilization deacetylase AcuC-like enzyme